MDSDSSAQIVNLKCCNWKIVEHVGPCVISLPVDSTARYRDCYRSADATLRPYPEFYPVLNSSAAPKPSRYYRYSVKLLGEAS